MCNIMAYKSHVLLILEMNKFQHLKWCLKLTKLNSEISCPIDSCLAQCGRALECNDQDAMGSNPTAGNS